MVNNNSRIVALGEIMLRLKPPGFERFLQSPQFEATFGGGEANAAISLAQFGLDVAFVTVLPNHAIGDACVRYLRSIGVDISLIIRQSDRMGVYYLEAGSDQRPSNVIYDRAFSAMACAAPDTFDWDQVFAGADWFHITGITPALSQTAADLSVRAVQEARARGLRISCDFSYRAKLWQYGKQPIDVMPELIRLIDVLIASEEDCESGLGVRVGERTGGDPERARQLGESVFATYPNLKVQAITRREGVSANQNAWWAHLYNGSALFSSQRYAMAHIVDRVGSGDAFAAGLIYGLVCEMGEQDALDFAAAACCLKHTIPGDANLVTVDEVFHLMRGGAAGRVQR